MFDVSGIDVLEITDCSQVVIGSKIFKRQMIDESHPLDYGGRDVV